MTGIEIVQVVTILFNLIVSKGIPAATAVMVAWQKQDPTMNDINSLHAIVRRPESYFEEPAPATPVSSEAVVLGEEPAPEPAPEPPPDLPTE
jgi:hypothetical protein